MFELMASINIPLIMEDTKALLIRKRPSASACSN